MVERCYSWLKELRRISTRYDKLMSSFNTMVCVTYIDHCLRADFGTKFSKSSYIITR